MDEKKEETQKTDKTEQKTETDKSETAEGDSNTGGKQEDDKIPAVEEAKKVAADIKTENDRREKILEEEQKVMDRKESLNALGGGSPAGDRPSKPAKMSDTEYAEALERGEVNPLKEDGFI